MGMIPGARGSAHVRDYMERSSIVILLLIGGMVVLHVGDQSRGGRKSVHCISFASFISLLRRLLASCRFPLFRAKAESAGSGPVVYEQVGERGFAGAGCR